MKSLTFLYQGRAVHIIRGEHKGKTVFHIYVSQRYLFFVSNPDTAKRIAVNFIDVVTAPAFMETGQCYSGGSAIRDMVEYRKKRS